MPKYRAKQQTVIILKKLHKIREFIEKENKSLVQSLLTSADELLKNISEVLEEEVDAELEKIAAVEDLEQNLQVNRYLHKCSNTLPKLKSKKEKSAFLKDLDADGFKEEITMSKSLFNKLYRIIKDYSLYKSLKEHKQTDIKLQLVLVLERIGSDRNAVSYKRSISNFTVFFFKIMLSMENSTFFGCQNLRRQQQ
ncbi:hypothetical protein PHYBLDRAFT_64466 [Phycomyces blakesleeanus NRRL 1555(-)]|uniref:Uncharacterized protein n=1 Tax=Phycomyces blakesleeanus (strain ATCC 8743b / DSM 1359 / FGSC 10004 / NBRC 33097 / NRRL 1555) TaxID=763407 RepID=A0A162UIT1_PHYB8|nr:hypothetical protein PHYBLDRAFT_64466 [Phycomyces blakesleeanus NRRL 1555(-)]OAD75553.1 hypothetical protein PHYBLDRAFT_64466 [Phycomyces blakesleeanus NRRL 1555(-)]|eukprot:XP_018293593.1 hypothetical protein PHYBLDRAFT_64466 [Phycomyces blakesleeanus NRRL 1555(-)]